MKLQVKAGMFLFFFLCMKAGFCVNAQEPVFEKDGEVYLIQSAQDMRTLALLVNRNKEVEPGIMAHDASYLLTRDIDLSPYCRGEEGWEPIGDRKTDDGYFNGTFDGGNHVVTGLYINRPKEDSQGLFGQSDIRRENLDGIEYQSRETTVIKNLYIKDCDITGAHNIGGIMGGMWNFMQDEGGDLFIENCHVTGKIVSEGEYVGYAGGIVGSASTVKNCSFTGTVEASSAGGIAGEAYYIYGCVVHADVSGLYRVGGIGGMATCVRNSYMTGSVAGYADVGGITGFGSCLTGCYTRTDVTGYNRMGGLIGTICFNGTPEPEGSSNVSTIQNCLMGGYRIKRVQETQELETVHHRNYDYNGYIYGKSRKLDDSSRITSPFYYRDGLVTEGFGKGMYAFSTWNCAPYDCTHLEETDFKDLIKRPEEKWLDVWYCADNYAWPNLSWEKESRFGYTVTVTVQEGDSLGKIADAVLGDSDLWDLIYEENRALIGDDPSLICPGIDLEITVNASLADYAAKGDVWLQAEEFLEKGQEQGISKAELKGFYRRLLVDDLWNGIVWKTDWKDFSRQLNDWIIADLDGNGQKDMIVMAGEGRVAVPGEIRLYFNGEQACILKDENAYYEDGFVFGSSFWEGPFMADLDNDGNLELLFAVGNGGNGGPGGRDNCLLRHEGNRWVECLQELPNDEDRGGLEIGLRISVIHIGVDRYEAYCPYLEERVEFDAKNLREISEDEFGKIAGANIRGFFDFQCVKYEGKNALQCREYLCGEGGNAYGVGEAVFLLVWDADGVCRVADWWVEGYMD